MANEKETVTSSIGNLKPGINVLWASASGCAARNDTNYHCRLIVVADIPTGSTPEPRVTIDASCPGISITRWLTGTDNGVLYVLTVRPDQADSQGATHAIF